MPYLFLLTLAPYKIASNLFTALNVKKILKSFHKGQGANMSRILSLFLITIHTLLLVAPVAHADEAGDIIKKVREKYNNLNSLKADFEQIFSWELAGETQEVSGKIYLKSGNKYRIETEDQLIVTNGKTVWTYSETNNQVVIDLLNKSPENPLPKDLLFEYSEEYIPHLVGTATIDKRKVYVLNLVPRDKDAFIKSMKIWVDTSDWFTRKIEQVDINDNINTYHVSNIEENIDLNDSLFNFKTPKDAEVVDLRESE